MGRYRVSFTPYPSFVILLTSLPCSYFITLTSFQPLYGKLSDIFGRKACLMFAYTIFGLGCLFCGLARNMNELIAARVSYTTDDEDMRG